MWALLLCLAFMSTSLLPYQTVATFFDEIDGNSTDVGNSNATCSLNCTNNGICQISSLCDTASSICCLCPQGRSGVLCEKAADKACDNVLKSNEPFIAAYADKTSTDFKNKAKIFSLTCIRAYESFYATNNITNVSITAFTDSLTNGSVIALVKASITVTGGTGGSSLPLPSQAQMVAALTSVCSDGSCGQIDPTYAVVTVVALNQPNYSKRYQSEYGGLLLTFLSLVVVKLLHN